MGCWGLVALNTTYCVWHVLFKKINKLKLKIMAGINFTDEKEYSKPLIFKNNDVIHVVVSTSNCEHVRGGLILRNNEWFIECRKCGELY